MENALGPCRLPYELLENDKKINSGYLLSTRDLCGLEYIPDFINSGVTCLKIEGRMKSPEYVATVTRIYRKYIDLAYSNNDYIVDKNDVKDLMQVFNRGSFSFGHLDNNPNKDLVFKEKPNNIGLYLGIVQKYNKAKGHITLKLKEPIEIGDTISFSKETSIYTISELMEKNNNISQTKIGQTVTIGRMKGNINLGDKIYKMSSKSLSTHAIESYNNENIKINLNCKITIKHGKPISMNITNVSNCKYYKDLDLNVILDNVIPEIAKNKPLQKETVIKQINRTSSTPYEFKNIQIDLDDSIFLPKLSSLNELRRMALSQVQNYALSKINRSAKKINYRQLKTINNSNSLSEKNSPRISLLLNILNLNYDYSNLIDIDNVYIPLKYFTNKKYSNIIKVLSQKFNTYIYMPTIVMGNYKNLCYSNIESAVKKYNVKGFIVSNLGNLKMLNDLFEDLDRRLKIIANYTFNVFNLNTILTLKQLGIYKFCISPELDKKTIKNLCNCTYLKKELIVYGKTPLINMKYCVLRRI